MKDQQAELAPNNSSDLPFFARIFLAFIGRMKAFFKEIDRKVEGGISFFLKNYGKSKFMISMSKKAQVLGLEKLFHKGPKAFVYFFLFYLVRDTILYIIIPIWFAGLTTN